MKIFYDKFKNNGEEHREGGPAHIEYNNDVITLEMYLIDGEIHREGGPAITFYNTDGSIFHEAYYIDGKEHREDGPAIIYYNNESINYKAYYKNGDRIG